MSKSQAPLMPVESITGFGRYVIASGRTASANAAMVTLRQSTTVYAPASWEFDCDWIWHPEGVLPSDSFIFGLPLPADNTKTGSGLVSLWIANLKRSARRFCSINLAVSCEVAAGAPA